MPPYHALPVEGGYRLANPAQGLAAQAIDAGLTIETGASQWSLRLAGWGYGSNVQPLEPAEPRAEGNRLEYRHGAATEWYVNGPLGLQQGFTLLACPVAERNAPREALTLQLTQTGDVDLILDEDRRGLTLARAGSPAILRYRGLSAYDATGRDLPAWIELEGRSLLLRVDDADAVYPVIVDPFVEQAKLTASDGLSNDRFGISVAVSGDTVVVGAINATAPFNTGAAYVFVKPAAGWVPTSTFTAKLSPPDALNGDQFGASVAVSGDTVVVGSIYHDSVRPNAGAAYVYVKPASGWLSTSAYTAKLTASDGKQGEQLGTSMALSGDTLLIGAPASPVEIGNGTAYVFVKPASGWVSTSAYAAKLTASDGQQGEQFGKAVALSGDTVVIGTPLSNVPIPAGGSRPKQGAAYVFVKPESGWVTTSAFTAKLTASDGLGDDQFGFSVAVSGDTALIGAYLDDFTANTSEGSAYVFVRPESGWTTTSAFTAKLTPSAGSSQGTRFGSSVALNGELAVIGAPGDTNFVYGAALVFVKPLSGWQTTSTPTEKLKASDAGTGDQAGTSLAMSGERWWWERPSTRSAATLRRARSTCSVRFH
jgi:hypothetical protein